MAAAIAAGRLGTPFDVLGIHPLGAPDAPGRVVRVFHPGAHEVRLLVGGEEISMVPRAPAGIFEAVFPEETGFFAYRLKVVGERGERIVEDPYRFPPFFDQARIQTMLEPGELRVQEVLGSRVVEHEGVRGTVFAVWAPSAARVSVVGGFNGWDGTRHPMRPRGSSGVWELFIPGIGHGAIYKYEIRSRIGELTFLKADPCGRFMELRPSNASVVQEESAHEWGDGDWVRERAERQGAEAPVAIYEVHLGSWKRKPGADPAAGEPGWLTYAELADELLPYVRDLGYTHVELLPVTEHPLDRSWGYQTVGYFAPTARYGTPDELRLFVDRAHQMGIGVILDWVPAHFPRDGHGLGLFDGTHLYEHADPRKGSHPDWGTYIFNYGRPQVASFLISSALYWIEEFHIDGIRVDAVASMLYLDYSRKEGEWIPNQYGGRENLEAIAFLREMNDALHAEHPGILTIAEESTAWPRVSHPTSKGGLGFDIKWNMGWMHDTLEVLQADPLFRKGLHQKLTFSMLYAWSEHFLLPLSHDEVVHLKRSVLSKMPGSVEQKLANLRVFYGYMYGHPGKKLLFMGGEFGDWREWNFEAELDWALLDEPLHHGLLRFVEDLNHLYRDEAALHETDFDSRGFEWIDCHDAARSTLSFLRWSKDWDEFLVVVLNLTPVAWSAFELGVPFPGEYRLVLNSDAREYGGSGELKADRWTAVEKELHGRPHALELELPPLSILFLRGEKPAEDGDDEAEGRDNPSPP